MDLLIRTELCLYCGKNIADQEHHVIKRSERPDLIDDKRNKIFICSECHSQTENSQDFYKKLQRIFLDNEFLEEVKYKI